MWKVAYGLLIAVFVCGTLYNKYVDYIMWFRYKDNAYEYMLNADHDRLSNPDPSWVYMKYRIEALDQIIDDESVMDSILIDLLRFRNDNGVLRSTRVQQSAKNLIHVTKRDHLQPYIDSLEVSFNNLPPGSYRTDYEVFEKKE